MEYLYAKYLKIRYDAVSHKIAYEPTDGSDAFFQRAVMELEAKAATKLELQQPPTSAELSPQTRRSPSRGRPGSAIALNEVPVYALACVRPRR